MGNAFSTTPRSGRELLEAAAHGDERAVARVLGAHASAVCYTRVVDRSSPLLAAAGAWHLVGWGADRAHMGRLAAARRRRLDGRRRLISSVAGTPLARRAPPAARGPAGAAAERRPPALAPPALWPTASSPQPPRRPVPTLLARNCPVAAAGHYRVVQQLLEAAEMSSVPERSAAVLTHTNRKGQTALILACAHGCARRRGC